MAGGGRGGRGPGILPTVRGSESLQGGGDERMVQNVIQALTDLCPS